MAHSHTQKKKSRLAMINSLAQLCFSQLLFPHLPPLPLAMSIYLSIYLLLNLTFSSREVYPLCITINYIIWIRCTSWFNAGSRIIENDLVDVFPISSHSGGL